MAQVLGVTEGSRHGGSGTLTTSATASILEGAQLVINKDSLYTRGLSRINRSQDP